MAIFKSISSISNVNQPMKSKLIAGIGGIGAGFGNNDVSAASCFDGTVTGSAKYIISGNNVNIADLKVIANGTRRAC